MIWKDKDKPKKREPEIEFVAPHSITVCKERLQKHYGIFHGVSLRSSAKFQEVDNASFRFRIYKSYNPRRYQSKGIIVYVGVQTKGQLIGQSSTTTMVAMRSSTNLITYLLNGIFTGFYSFLAIVAVIFLIKAEAQIFAAIVIIIVFPFLMYWGIYEPWSESERYRYQLLSQIRKLLEQ